MPTSTGRPIVLLMDLLGKRWAMRVIWELREPAESFRALQARCGDISSSVLWQRVNELKDAGFIDAEAERGLHLTDAGAEMIGAFMPLLDFAARWARRRNAN
jgi:DNA-binding HxlR family transcriptional regulator